MSPQHPPNSDSFKEKVVQLETKLNYMYKTVKRLQQQVNQVQAEQTAKPPETTKPIKTSNLPGFGFGFLFGIGLMMGGFWFISSSFFQSIRPQLKTFLLTQKIPKLISISPVIQPPQPVPEKSSPSAWIYNIQEQPELSYSKNLQTIIDQVVERVKAKNLPTKNLSIHLIDVNRKNYAEYRSQIPRFPASITKLFWMVALYDQVEKNQLSRDLIDYTPECLEDVCQLIKKSNNESASRILDQITQTSSVPSEQTEPFEIWLEKRHSINQFFQKAGYQDIDVSQKNFPIPYLKMENPQHRDLEMRGDDKQPFRNQISADQAARLMYEIVTEEAVSPTASREMLRLLEQDLDPTVWRQEESNPIAGFLGEGLVNTEVRFASKVGWTSSTRFEVAAIHKNQKISYIITVFGQGSPYARNEKVFPEISQFIYEEMAKNNN